MAALAVSIAAEIADTEKPATKQVPGRQRQITERRQNSTLMDNLSAHIASAYDAQVRNTILFYDLIQGEVLRLFKAAKPDVASWVETSCDTRFLVELALAAFPQTHFTLADPAEAMLAQARKRLGAATGRITILPPTDSTGLTKHLPFWVCASSHGHPIQCHHYLQAAERRRTKLPTDHYDRVQCAELVQDLLGSVQVCPRLQVRQWLPQNG